MSTSRRSCTTPISKINTTHMVVMAAMVIRRLLEYNKPLPWFVFSKGSLRHSRTSVGSTWPEAWFLYNFLPCVHSSNHSDPVVVNNLA